MAPYLRIRNFCSIIDVLVILSISLEDVAALRHEGLLLSPLRPSLFCSVPLASYASFRRKTLKIPSVTKSKSLTQSLQCQPSVGSFPSLYSLCLICDLLFEKSVQKDWKGPSRHLTFLPYPLGTFDTLLLRHTDIGIGFFLTRFSRTRNCPDSCASVHFYNSLLLLLFCPLGIPTIVN